MARTDENQSAHSRTAALFVAGLVVGSVAGLGGVLAFDAVWATEPVTAMPPPRFVEESAAAGVRVYDGDFTFFVGGGVAVVDCSDDGLPDLYFAGGSNPAALYRNEARSVASCGSLTSRSRYRPHRGRRRLPVDIDGDAVMDLAVLRVGENVLLRGLGDCRFERANEAWGFDGGDDWTAAFSATWRVRRLPTLAIGNYLDLADIRQATCADSELVRPSAGEATYAEPIPLTPGTARSRSCSATGGGRGSATSAWRTTATTTRTARNSSGASARVSPRARTPKPRSWQRLVIWGMGIATYDVTGDGLPEVFITSQGDNRLQTLADGPSRPTYEHRARPRRHGPSPVHRRRPAALHGLAPEFQGREQRRVHGPVRHEGQRRGHPPFASKDPDNLLLGQPDGTFIEGAEAAGIARFVRARGAALVDLNLDGLLDLVQVNRRENVSLWRNVGRGSAAEPEPMGNWSPSGSRPGRRDAVGAWIAVRSATERSSVRSWSAGSRRRAQADPRRARRRADGASREGAPWLELRSTGSPWSSAGRMGAEPGRRPGGEG